jgi:predicted nuclease of predicted toxin-antitoxin system
VKLLLDECLHPEVARLLVEAGHDDVTVADLGMVGATDPDVLAVAGQQKRILVTLDTDFGESMVRNVVSDQCGVLLIRRRDHRPAAIAAVVGEVLASCRDALLEGALAVVGERTVRLRELPPST